MDISATERQAGPTSKLLDLYLRQCRSRSRLPSRSELTLFGLGMDLSLVREPKDREPKDHTKRSPSFND